MFDDGDGRRWALAFDGCYGWQLWQQWTIEMMFNDGGEREVQCWQQHLTAFNGKDKTRQCRGKGGRYDESGREAVQGEATQQTASTMRGQKARGLRNERMMRADDAITARWKADGGNRRIADAKARLAGLERSLAEAGGHRQHREVEEMHDNVAARENNIM